MFQFFQFFPTDHPSLTGRARRADDGAIGGGLLSFGLTVSRPSCSFTLVLVTTADFLFQRFRI